MKWLRWFFRELKYNFEDAYLDRLFDQARTSGGESSTYLRRYLTESKRIHSKR